MCDKISSTDLSCLIKNALHLCATHNLNVWSITCDGLISNFSAMKNLGCSFGSKIKEMCGSFPHPEYDHPIYYIPDPCHMLKLARNALCSIGIFVDEQNQYIKWDHIKALHKLQEEEGFKFANKLGNYHIDFRRHKMNVKIAAQTLSGSVADAIEFLMVSGHPSLF